MQASINNLMDDSGAKTTTTVVWRSSNTYKIESERTDTEERKLARSYLADGGGRNLVIVSNIPYEKCNLYVLLTPASSAFYRHTDVTLTVSSIWEPVGSGSLNHGLAIHLGRNATGDLPAIIPMCRG